MPCTSRLSILLSLLFLFPLIVFSKPSALPLIIWHGLGDNYAADGLEAVAELAQKVHPGTFVYNVRLDSDPDTDRRATFFGNLTEQLEQVCADVAAHPVLGKADYVDALGFSQGGQFLRGMVERCSGLEFAAGGDDASTGVERETAKAGRVPRVRSLVTFGAQHNGIAEFRACAPTDWVCRSALGLLRSNAWSDFVQSRVVPAQYYRDLNESTGRASDDYLAHSNFLADVNNEREEKNATYKNNVAQLKKFVMYVFEDDETVIPKESGWFAEVNRTSGDVTPLRERLLYREDWLGLKTLDEKDALVFKKAPGEHMQLSDDILEEAFKEYFGPPKDGGSTMTDQTRRWHNALEL